MGLENPDDTFKKHFDPKDQSINKYSSNKNRFKNTQTYGQIAIKKKMMKQNPDSSIALAFQEESGIYPKII